jgi:hypothetical protein
LYFCPTTTSVISMDIKNNTIIFLLLRFDPTAYSNINEGCASMGTKCTAKSITLQKLRSLEFM